MRVQRVKTGRKFRILHCLRAPVGGLFRHVCDLAIGQQLAGHEVAVVCAASGDTLTERRLSALAAHITGGVHRLEMSRSPGLADVTAARRVTRLSRELRADVVHGHGAKGGAYARLAARGNTERLAVYTPHGGSLHYAPSTLTGRAVAAAERHFERMTAGIVFESRYSAQRYGEQIGTPRVPTRVIANGVKDTDFQSIDTDADATDILFVGELRQLKGVDVLLEALALVAAKRPVTATIVGDGPDRALFEGLVTRRGLEAVVHFTGAMPARDAFRRGRVLVLPSRAESFPYIVLEAGACGLAQIVTRVGGIAEIIGETGTPMIPPGNAEALATVLFDHLANDTRLSPQIDRLRQRIRENFTVEVMTTSVLGFYEDLTRLAQARQADRRLTVAPE